MKSPVTSITDDQLAELEEICRQQAFTCCGNYSVGGEYMGQWERVCCMEPESTEKDISWPAEEILDLIARLRAAEADAKLARKRVEELDLLFGRYLLAMKASVVEAENGRGYEAAMQWIINSLAGPGEMPPEDEPDAQAFFDREIEPINDAMAELFEARRAAMDRKA